MSSTFSAKSFHDIDFNAMAQFRASNQQLCLVAALVSALAHTDYSTQPAETINANLKFIHQQLDKIYHLQADLLLSLSS